MTEREMKNKLCIYILFLLLGCIACNFSTTQGKYKTLANETWERDSNYKFELDITGLKTVVQPIDRIFHFDSTGIYTVEIKHRMKDKQLTGIKNIGIKIKSTTYYGEE